MKHIPPSIDQTAFVCPHCGAFAEQSWYSLGVDKLFIKEKIPVSLKREHLGSVKDLPLVHSNIISGFPTLHPHASSRAYRNLYNVFAARCSHCEKVSIWNRNNLVYPQSSDAPPANPDLPDDIRKDYDEASNILNSSPRGAAALLRLVVQKLCKELGQKGKYINDDIAALVLQGLSQQIQQALDTVRVIGNDAVHPGQIDLSDDRKTTLSLFALVNLIVDRMISEPKRIKEAYQGLPKSKLEGIANRDS